MEKPNPNDPTMVDVYDDATGEYVTTLPAQTDPVSGAAMPNADPHDTSKASDIRRPIQALGRALEVPPLAAAGEPERQGTTETDSMDPGAADAIEGLLTPGMADMATGPEMIPGSPGGMQVSQRQSTGLSPERAAGLIGEVESAATDERAALLDESLAKQIALDESRKEQARLEAEIKQKQAENALEVKANMDRRKKVEDRFQTVSTQEPDRNRAFPTGWNLVATYIGGIAAGMLQGLNGGRNQVLDSLMQRLDDDVKQQRLTQSEQLKDLTRQLGSVDAAEDMLRATQKEVVLKETEARLMGTANKVAPAQIDAFRKRMNVEITRHKVDAISKLDRDLTIQEQYNPGTSPQEFNAESFRNTELTKYAQANGLKPGQAHDQWNKFNESNLETAAVRGALATAQRAIAKYQVDGDVSGFGFLGDKVPSTLAGKDAVSVRQTIGTLMSARIKQLSGSAASEGEVGRIRESLVGPGDFDSMSQGLTAMDAEFKNLDAAKRDQNAGFYRMQQTIRNLNRNSDVPGQPGRAYQEGQVRDVVTIPDSARIAKVHNNPGNLTYVGQRNAEKGEPKEGGGYWAKFPDVNAGMRELAMQVTLDQERGLNVRQFVEKYAPSKDGNNVESYIEKIKRSTGADEQTALSELSAGRLTLVLANIKSGSR